MKFNLILNKQSIVIDAPEHLAYVSILLDEISPEFSMYEEIYTWLCGEIIKLGRIHFENDAINFCEFKYPTFKEQEQQGIIDNVHLYIIK